MDSNYRWSNFAIVGRSLYQYKGEPHRLLYYSAGPSLALLKESEYRTICHVFPKRTDSKLFCSLLKRGIIRTDSPHDESSNAINRLFSPDCHSGSFAIMTTNDCNMRCGYCGQVHCKENMSSTECDKVADHIIKSVKANQLSSINLRWYGGEPLLNTQAIFEISRKIKTASHLMDFSFSSTMASNAVLLSRTLVKDLISDAHLTKLAVTLDGFKEAHDQSRPLLLGESSYEKIRGTLFDISKLEHELSNLLVTIRVNITNHNYREIPSLISDLGFLTGNKHFTIQFMPVYEWGENSKEYRLNRSTVSQSVIDYLTLTSRMGIQTELLPLQTLQAPCMASTVMAELISVEGEIYSCTEQPLTGDNSRSLSLGSIDKCGPLPRKTGKLDFYQSTLINSRCGHCPFFPVCGGGCPRKQVEGTFDCPNYRTTFSKRCDIIAKNLGLDKIVNDSGRAAWSA